MFKLKYSQKIGILISLISSLFVILVFASYSWVFTISAKTQARNKMIYEVNEVINNFITYENEKLTLTQDSNEIMKDLTRDRLSLAIYNTDLTVFQTYGLFNSNSDLDLDIFKNYTSYTEKLSNVTNSKISSYHTLKNRNNGSTYELLISPIMNENEVVGLIALIAPYEQIEWMINFSNLLILSMLPLILIISYFIGIRISKQAYKPILNIIDKVKNTSTDNLLGNVNLEGHIEDESYILGLEYNKLIERLREGVTKQRLFISNASHELRTPLARLQSYVDLIEDNKLSNDLTEQVKNLSDKLEIITQLAQLEKTEPKNINNKDLETIIRNLKEKYVINLTRLQFNIAGNIDIKISQSHLITVLDNLISNALKYSNDKVIVNFKDNEIEVIDKGVGISEYDKKYITQPFYRSQNVINIDGNGLGLKLVKDILDSNGLILRIESIKGEGSKFIIVAEY